jgi:hypothetical protein
VQVLFELLRFRNSHPAFNGTFQLLDTVCDVVKTSAIVSRAASAATLSDIRKMVEESDHGGEGAFGSSADSKCEFSVDEVGLSPENLSSLKQRDNMEWCAAPHCQQPVCMFSLPCVTLRMRGSNVTGHQHVCTLCPRSALVLSCQSLFCLPAWRELLSMCMLLRVLRELKHLFMGGEEEPDPSSDEDTALFNPYSAALFEANDSAVSKYETGNKASDASVDAPSIDADCVVETVRTAAVVNTSRLLDMSWVV